jgi:hypothetical protein
LALAEFFEASRRTRWHRFGQFGNAFVELALHEHATHRRRACSAMRATRGDAKRHSADAQSYSLHFETALDAETLERLLADGKALDEEAVCALTLEAEGCG